MNNRTAAFQQNKKVEPMTMQNPLNVLQEIMDKCRSALHVATSDGGNIAGQTQENAICGDRHCKYTDVVVKCYLLETYKYIRGHAIRDIIDAINNGEFTNLYDNNKGAFDKVCEDVFGDNGIVKNSAVNVQCANYVLASVLARIMLAHHRYYDKVLTFFRLLYGIDKCDYPYIKEAMAEIEKNDVEEDGYAINSNNWTTPSVTTIDAYMKEEKRRDIIIEALNIYMGGISTAAMHISRPTKRVTYKFIEKPVTINGQKHH